MNKQLTSIIIRYLILIIIAVPNLYLFYFVFTPLTIYFIYFFLNIFSQATLQGNTILFQNSFFKIIPACVAGSAYYLLLILNLSTPKIKFSTRINSIFLAFAIFLFLNITRIIILIFLFNTNFSFFNLAHKISWYFLSTIFIIGIWFFEVKLFKIKNIPFYTDLKFLLKLTRK